MHADSFHATTRFSQRVENYVRFRPGYPREVVTLLAGKVPLTASSLVADIGSGTGLLSRAFLEEGYEVVGVEPNAEMRSAGMALLDTFPRFRSAEGMAESLPLRDNSVDLAVAGQAFHWFRVAEAREEWRRILKSGGMAALIWNERSSASPFMRETEDLIDRYAEELDPDGAIREGGRSRIEPFFRPSPVQLSEFPHTQEFGLEGLLGRIASCSYIPPETDPRYPELAAELERIFARHEQNGLVRFEYVTKVYGGRLS